jgi:Peptidase family C25
MGYCAPGQRVYAPHSVLATGNWYKIAVTAPGLYRIDVAFLNTLGIPTNGLASNTIRIFGNGGQLPDEAANAPYTDDLRENACWVSDGGDGIFNNSDFLLFYAPGPDGWVKDSANAAFRHTRNLYDTRSYYFISIGGNGLRIPQTNAPGSANVTVTSYNARFFHELDTLNFLRSGKEWYGEEFAVAPGKINTRNFNISLPGYVVGTPVSLRSSVVSRSSTAFSRFDLRVNGALVLQQPVSFTGSGPADPFAVADEQQIGFVPTQTPFNLIYTYTPGNVNAQGWLNFFELQARATLSMAGSAFLSFRDWQSVGTGNQASFLIQNAPADTRVWDITEVARPVQQTPAFSGNTLQFVAPASQLREYIAFSGSNFPAPQPLGRLSNQDLHGYAPADILLIVPEALRAPAARLATHRAQAQNLRTALATTEQIANEFGSGTLHPVAIRDFAKMMMDRAGSNPALRPRFLLLFGTGSFDYKNRVIPNTNLIPAYQSHNSLAPLATYTSDDFFGFLDDADNINDPARLNLLDIAIGRLPVRTLTEAEQVTDKLIAYAAPAAQGAWRNEVTLVGDDEDNNFHFEAAEQLSTTINNAAPELNLTKVYLDAFRQQSGAGGSRYPEANTVVNNKANSGNILWNYSGHGSRRRLAEEVILDDEALNNWKNESRLPLLITATCDFAPYDDPIEPALGSQLLLRAKTGAIGLVTTTRLVFANSNQLLNNTYLNALFTRRADGSRPAIGEALQSAKNTIYQFSPDLVNNRKFTLLGDPALPLALPMNKVKVTEINGRPVGSIPDTIKALGAYTIRGQLTDVAGNLLNNANGALYATVFDKAQRVNTLANDPGSAVASFAVQNSILFRGKVKMTGGNFAFSFIVPADISPQYGNGRMSFYAEAASGDGSGSDNNIVVGGRNPDAVDDKTGPFIRAFLNDDKFVNGGLCNETPILLVRLKDSAGINSSGLGIGHDITAVLDNDNRQLFELNAYYETDLDSYRSGSIRFQLPRLTPGKHTLAIRAWDVFNNPSEYLLEFTVANSEAFVINHVLNYPNPFTTKTQFWFEHNRPGEDLQAMIRIMTITGKVVKTISRTINTTGNRSCELEWDGRDDFGQPIGRGVYWYTLSIYSRGQRQTKVQKLVIL